MEWSALLLISLVGFTFYLFSEVRSLRMRIRRLEKQAYPSSVSLSSEFEQELQALLREDKVVQAVKRVREEHGLSLLEAKQFVDQFHHKEV